VDAAVGAVAEDDGQPVRPCGQAVERDALLGGVDDARPLRDGLPLRHRIGIYEDVEVSALT
jgi:hypothetical protein